MKPKEVWHDRKFSHRHIVPDKYNWVAMAIILVLLGLDVMASIQCGRWIFRHGTATPSDVLFGGAGILLDTFTSYYFVRWLFFAGRRTWQRNIRGYVLWILTSPIGREWRVITPRGQRPKLNGVELFAFGVPLGGWWPYGEVWKGSDCLDFQVRLKREWQFKVEVRDMYYRDRISFSYDGDSSGMRLFRTNADATHGTWWDVLRQVQSNFEVSRAENSELRQKVVQQDQAVRWYKHNLGLCEATIDRHFERLMNSSRLIFSQEGQEITRQLRQDLLSLNLRDYPRLKYEQAQIPPRRGRRSMIETVTVSSSSEPGMHL